MTLLLSIPATLTVVPSPDTLTSDHATLSLGSVPAGQSVNLSVQLSNPTAHSISVMVSGSAPVTAGFLGGGLLVIPAGATVSATVVFSVAAGAVPNSYSLNIAFTE